MARFSMNPAHKGGKSTENTKASIHWFASNKNTNKSIPGNNRCSVKDNHAETFIFAKHSHCVRTVLTIATLVYEIPSPMPKKVGMEVYRISGQSTLQKSDFQFVKSTGAK